MQTFSRGGKDLTLEQAQEWEKENRPQKKKEVIDEKPIEEIEKPVIDVTKPVIVEPVEQKAPETIEIDKEKLFKDMTLEELKVIAKEEKIRGFGIMKRETLINKLS